MPANTHSWITDSDVALAAAQTRYLAARRALRDMVEPGSSDRRTNMHVTRATLMEAAHACSDYCAALDSARAW